MTYDSSISSEVSLSKVLDFFISENEDHDLVVSFLKQHDDSFKDIAEYSLSYCQIFQLDFFLNSSEYCQDYIVSKLCDIPLDDAALLTWQILRSNSSKAQKVKYRFRKELDWILKYGPNHPYNFRHETYIAPLDNTCFKLAESDDVRNIAKIVPYEKLCNYYKYMHYSLFQSRLMQYDTFNEMNDISKFVFIRDTFSNVKLDKVKRFAMQIFDSNEEYDVKKICYDKLCDIKRTHAKDSFMPKQYVEIIEDCKSFSEMMLKMSIFSADANQSLVLYLMLYKPKWILDWVEYDENELNSMLNVSSFAKKRFIAKSK